MNTNQTERILTPEERVKYNLPPLAECGPRSKRQQTSSGAGKSVGVCALGIAAGVVGAAGVSAYAMPHAPKEPDHLFPKEDHSNCPEGSTSTVKGDSNTAPVGVAAAHNENQQNAFVNQFPIDDGELASPVDSNTASEGVEADHNENLQSTLVDQFSIDDVKFASSPVDSMPFNQAFAMARAEVGANGVFEWRGGYYGTFYSDEWKNQPSSYRQQFSNHDWSELQFEEPSDPGDPIPENEDAKVIIHEDGRVEIVMTNASTGEEIHYFPDGEVVPVVDDHGQVIAMVNKSALEEAERSGGVLAVLPSGDPVIVDDPANVAAIFEDSVAEASVDDSFDPMEEFSAQDVVDGSADDNVFAVIDEDMDLTDEVFAAIDDDPVVMDVNDEVYIAEVVDDDFAFIPDAETMDDFDPAFDSDSGDELAYSDDINFEDHGMVDDGFDDMMDDDMFLS